jgi:hypothetical protein
MGRVAPFLGATFGFGLLAGLVLDVLTFLVARFGPQGSDGGSWSLRGNGALIVPFGLGPAVIAATWSALALKARGAAHWRSWSLSAGAVGILIVLMSVMVLVLFGSAGQAASNWLSILPLLWMVVAPTLAMVLPVQRTSGQHKGFACLLAGLLFLASLVAGFSGAALVISPG